jgi:hypothetical protein
MAFYRTAVSFWYDINGTASVIGSGLRMGATLTGAADSLSDLELPLISYQARITNGVSSPHYFRVPFDQDLYESVSARPNGEVVVKQEVVFDDGTSELSEFTRVNFDRVQKTLGGISSTMTLQCSKQFTNTDPVTIQGEEILDWGIQYDGKRTFKTAGKKYIRVGDFFDYGDGIIEIGTINVALSPREYTFEIQEA